jgi:hypothetical protein
MSSTSFAAAAKLPRSLATPYAPAVRAVPAQAKGAIDWPGRWFKLDEEVSKEFVGIRFAKAAPGKRDVSWTYVSHIDFDGMGALAHLVKQDEQQRDVALPTLRDAYNPGWLAAAGAQLRFFLRKFRPSANWKSLDPSWREPARSLPAGTAVATGMLDVERTQCFSEKARALGVSTNSLLLSALVRASRPYVGRGPALWRVPVNMRGPVAAKSALANTSSFVEVRIGADDSAPHVHRQIKSCLTRREHWAVWYFANIGRLVGDRGMRILHTVYHWISRGRPWVGSLSNLGTWNGIGDWYFGPGCQYTSPVGAGVIICNGKLLLTLEAHLSIARDRALPQTLMNRWIAEIEA